MRSFLVYVGRFTYVENRLQYFTILIPHSYCFPNPLSKRSIESHYCWRHDEMLVLEPRRIYRGHTIMGNWEMLEGRRRKESWWLINRYIYYHNIISHHSNLCTETCKAYHSFWKMTSISLFRSLLREAKQVTDYNFRTYSIRRVKAGFRKNQHLQG